MRVLITGGCNDINFEVAKRISLYNKVYIGIYKEDELKTAKERIKKYRNIKIIKLDVTNYKDLRKIKRYEFDKVVLNSSIYITGSILDIPIEKIKECYEVNVFGMVNVIKSVIKNMYNNDYGRIVIISSLMGLVPKKFMGIYGSTKSSLNNLSIALKKELKLISKNIKISLVETGFNTIKKESKIFRFIEKHNLNLIVNKIEDAIMSDKPKFIYRVSFLQALFKKIEILLFY